MSTETILLWTYVAAMAVGAVVFIAMSRNPQGVPGYEYAIAAFIPIWSGLAYMAMALDQGKIGVAGQITYYARYLDWVVTTPLLLLALSLTAMHSIPKDKGLIFGLMGADVVMIVCGLIADLSTGATRYIWYLCGVGAFVAILSLIWGPLKAKADEQGAETAAVFRRVAGLLSVLWIAYPTIWILGPSGLGVIGQPLDTALFVLVPIISKVIWSYVDLTSLRALKRGESPARPSGEQSVDYAVT